MCTVLLPSGVNPIAINKYIYIYIFIYIYYLTKNITQCILPAFSYIFRYFLTCPITLFKKKSHWNALGTVVFTLCTHDFIYLFI
jgi:hypothetical protein